MKTHSDLPSGSHVKPLAILATVDLRPKPVGTEPPSSAAESQATVNDDVSNPALVSLIICWWYTVVWFWIISTLMHMLGSCLTGFFPCWSSYWNRCWLFDGILQGSCSGWPHPTLTKQSQSTESIAVVFTFNFLLYPFYSHLNLCNFSFEGFSVSFFPLGWLFVYFQFLGLFVSVSFWDDYLVLF